MIKIYFLIFCFVVVVTSAPATSEETVMSLKYFQKRYSEHMRRVGPSNYKCLPRPRVFTLKEIAMPEILIFYKDHLSQITPFSTVLHRCEGTGCCPNYNQICQPIDIEDVTLTFSMERKEYFEFDAANHTKCSCGVVSKSWMIY